MSTQFRWYMCEVQIKPVSWKCTQIHHDIAKLIDTNKYVVINVSKSVPCALDKMYITSQLYPSVVLDPPAANKFP